VEKHFKTIHGDDMVCSAVAQVTDLHSHFTTFFHTPTKEAHDERPKEAHLNVGSGFSWQPFVIVDCQRQGELKDF